MVVEVARAPLGAFTLSESSSDPQGSGEVALAPKGSSDMEPVPEGSGEPETPSVRQDWAATTLMIVPDGLRLMSFNSCLMGTLILIPDSSPRACGGVGHSTGFTIGCQGLHSPGGAREHTRRV
jgi:hypothetical protein